jgi:hypothetical protein
MTKKDYALQRMGHGNIFPTHVRMNRCISGLASGGLIFSKDWIRTGFNAVQGRAVYDVVILFDVHQARWIRERQIHQAV